MLSAGMAAVCRERCAQTAVCQVQEEGAALSQIKPGSVRGMDQRYLFFFVEERLARAA